MCDWFQWISVCLNFICIGFAVSYTHKIHKARIAHIKAAREFYEKLNVLESRKDTYKREDIRNDR